ncbi:hypothetical protein BDV93DRAFT_525748 [Ceratobasidium sp. AG-I]|nr:hypothetical protein BDV93DRAFT_525748 [Ceratobasidium sp. AG-I]
MTQVLGGTEMPEFVATVLQEWENGRTHLAKAVKSYVGATAALRAAIITYPLWTLHSLTSTLEEEIESLPLELLELEKARMVLANARNTQCSPINRLPSELLVSIFQIVVDSAYPYDSYDCTSYANPAAKLVQVCSRWHQVASEAGTLWSCVVIPYQGRGTSERVLTTARMQLQRTYGSSINLFISHKLFYYPDNFWFQSTNALITPYMNQIHSLTVRLPRGGDAEMLLNYCTAGGTAGTLSRLEIAVKLSPTFLFHQADSQTLGQIDEYLRSVRTLKLRSAAFDWQCAVFEQLGELVLCNLNTRCCPNLTQLAGVLSASPGLRDLRLKETTIRDETEPMVHSPVRLEHLEKLVLDRLDDASSCRAISILSLGEQGLYLTFNVDSSSSTVLLALRQFATKNRIETFRYTGVSARQPLQEILESLPDLSYLMLDKLKLGKSDFDALIHCNGAPLASPSSPPSPPLSLEQTSPTSPLPKLKRLTFVDATILCDQATFKKAISSLSLCSFRLQGCSIETITESQKKPGGAPTKLGSIGATSELGIWLTENLGDGVTFS